MPGLRDLTDLLATMSPALSAVDYGYAALPPGQGVPATLHPFAVIAEEEGLTLIAPVADLLACGIAHQAGWARISLTVHSDLAAVGLTAAIATALATAGISANVVAGYFHDHIFVQRGLADQAMAVLAGLTGAGVAGDE